MALGFSIIECLSEAFKPLCQPHSMCIAQKGGMFLLWFAVVL